MCKRDFAQKQVEDWIGDKQFFGGDAPNAADFELASLWLGNNWVKDEAFSGLPWRHAEAVAKFPNTKRVIDNVLALPGVKDFVENDLVEGCICVDKWNTHVASQVLAKELPAAKGGRKFKITTEGDEEMIHPNAVPYVEGAKEKYDMCL